MFAVRMRRREVKKRFSEWLISGKVRGRDCHVSTYFSNWNLRGQHFRKYHVYDDT